MRTKLSIVLLLAASAVTSLSAHVMVSPPQSTAGALQKYELRVHNEAKAAATSVDLDIPDGVTVTEVAKLPAGTFTTKMTGNRITVITWQIDVPPTKYVALPFTAKNPDGVAELRWTMHEHLADGSVVDWSDKPGSKEKGSVTKLAASTAAAVAAGNTWAGTISDKCVAPITRRWAARWTTANAHWPAPRAVRRTCSCPREGCTRGGWVRSLRIYASRSRV